MAVDDAMLEAAATAGIARLRFYTWSEPTLSLGYFQEHAERQSHPPSLACPLVRRATGGGAILHDRELTYSIALPSLYPLSREAKVLYQGFHRTLVEVLSEKGIEARLCPADLPTPEGEPFLCFQRRAEGDVLLGEHKVVGSAQRRRRGAVLQHGSLLLRRSEFAPELAGVADLAGCEIEADWLIDRWLEQLAESAGFRWISGGPPNEQIARILQEKYLSAAWNRRR